MRVPAVAKVNLSLRVLGRRDDGFHEIRTWFQAIDLADEIRVDRGGTGISLHVEGAEVGPERENLAYRAAETYLKATGETHGVRIELLKRIPAGAGLGGGSSDAAAVLKCLAASSASVQREDLALLGAALGSDVPFFLGASPLARGEGRGETLTELTALPEAHLVLALPPVHVSTRDAYRALGRGRMEEGGTGDPKVAPGEVQAGGASVATPRGWDDVTASAHNDFEPVIAPLHGEIGRSLDALRGAGAKAALLSGSGGASFGIFGSAAEASRVAAALERDLGWTFRATRTLTRMPQPLAL